MLVSKRPDYYFEMIRDKIDSYTIEDGLISNFKGIIIPRVNVQLDSFIDIFFPHICDFNYTLEEEKTYYSCMKEWFPILRYLGDRYLNHQNCSINWDAVRNHELLPLHGSFYFNENARIKKDDVVFDIGAAPGDFTATAFAKGAKTVYAFEPSQNGLKKLHHLSEVSKKIDIVDMMVGSKVVEDSQMITLDHYCKIEKIDKLDFIKMDVEGMENEVLIGAERILSELHPNMAICTYHKPGDRKKLTESVLKINSNYKITYGRSVMYCYIPSYDH